MVEVPFESTIVATADTPTAVKVWREAAAFAQTVRGNVVFCLLDLDDRTTHKFVESYQGRVIGPTELRSAHGGVGDGLEELDSRYVPSRFWVSPGAGDELLLRCVEEVAAPVVMAPRHFNSDRPRLDERLRNLTVAANPVGILFVKPTGKPRAARRS
jgi:hypothetical protein